jgi:hypothetical protein
MKEDAAAVLLRIARDVEAQVHFLANALARPEVDRTGASRSSLELILKSFAAHLKKVGDPELDRIAAELDALERNFADVALHLEDLKAGWRCRFCGSKVVRAASVRGDPAKPIPLLVCERCGEKSELTSEGRAVFDRVFGHLIGAEWRPRLNGFLEE